MDAIVAQNLVVNYVQVALLAYLIFTTARKPKDD